MATGDITLTKVGVFSSDNIASGVTGQNVVSVSISSANLVYVPMASGQVMVLKEVRAI